LIQLDGSKAFSYFNLVAKNWFIQKVKNQKKKNKFDTYFDKTIIDKIEKNDCENKEISLERKYIA